MTIIRLVQCSNCNMFFNDRSEGFHVLQNGWNKLTPEVMKIREKGQDGKLNFIIYA